MPDAELSAAEPRASTSPQSDPNPSPLEELLAFSQTLPMWQRDTLRRLYNRPTLSVTDLDEVIALMREELGLATRPARVPAPKPLTRGDIPQRTVNTSPVLIHSLEGVVNVNRLAKNQELRFASDGLTIIYGENAAGKSGYCRILKKLCRVRSDVDEQLLNDVFGDATGELPEVTVRFGAADEAARTVLWRGDMTPPEGLSGLVVFDAKAVPLYANEQRRIEVLPQGLDILPGLAEACRTLAVRFAEEIKSIQQRIAMPVLSLPAQTIAGQLVSSLSWPHLSKQPPSEAEIRAAATWTDDDDLSLSVLERELATDATAVATRLRRLHGILLALLRRLESAEQAISAETHSRLAEQAQAAATARAAATLVSQLNFQNEPLSGVGSEQWRLLFHSAAEYSAIAYPGRAFPVTDADARCVLCQQVLDAEAAGRLHRFNTFVESAAEQTLAKLESKRESDLETLSRAPLVAGEDWEPLLNELLEVGHDELANRIRETVLPAIDVLARRRSELHEAVEGARSFDAVVESDPAALTAGRNCAEQLRLAADAIDSAENRDRRVELEARIAELRGRKSLNENLTSVLSRREQVVELQNAQACRGACDTGDISRKSTEMRRRFVTQDYTDRLLQEVDALRLGHLRLRVEDSTTYGVGYLRVTLDSRIRVENRDVLSEGEFRALGLACFFADVGGARTRSGIVLDDPASSFDHVRVRQVAERLVTEAKKGRQVIVFTHDLVFYHELISKAGEQSVKVALCWLRQTASQGCGVVHQGDAPWQVASVSVRVSKLAEKLRSLKPMSDFAGNEYRDAVTDFYTGLRETWERLVEEILLNKVVQRFQTDVKTQSLKGVEVTDIDYRDIYYGMKRASCYSGHDAAGAKQASLPAPPELEGDLTVLQRYYETLRQRIKGSQARRKTIEAPPEATLL